MLKTRWEIWNVLFGGGKPNCTIPKVTYWIATLQNRTLSAINTAEGLVKSGQTGQNVARQLVDDARDILAVALDAKVGFA